MPTVVERWSVALGDRSATVFSATGVLVDREPRAWLAVSAVAGILLLVFLVFQSLRLVRSRRAARTVRASAADKLSGSTGIKEEQRSTAEPAHRKLRLVVLGGIGVVWDAGGDPEGLLVPFVREQGGVVDPREVADRYRAVSLGQMSRDRKSVV